MNHHLESLGWTLLHFCWQAAAIAFVYWLAETALPKVRSQTRYILALAALLLMLVGALATFAYEESSSRFDAPISADTSLSAANASAEASGPVGLSLAGLGAPVSANHDPQWPVSSLLAWLDIAWLAGVACLSMRTLVGLQLIQRLRKRALMDAPEAVRESFAALCRHLAITRKVSLRVSEHIQGPFAMGVFRAMILLPASALTALTPEQLEVVLMHELAHVRRADYLWNLVQRTIETLFFFHPAVWWIGSKLRQERELCCDDMAVQLCADPLTYATALLRLEEQRTQRLNLVMALDGNRPLSSLRMRIARVLGEADAEQERRQLTPLPLIAICAALLLALLPAPKLFAGLPAKSQEPQSTVTATANIAAPVVAAAAPATSIIAAPATAQISAAVSAPVVADQVKTTPAETARVDTAIVNAEGAGTSAGSGSGYGAGASSGYGASSGQGGSDAEGVEQQESSTTSTAHKADYIDKMRAAGYDVDLDKYVAMKVQGITPEYARDMEKAGFGKPSADDLISLKVQGVTPEYIAGLRSAGLAPSSIGDLVSYRIFNVTPEFVASMKAAGFDSIPPRKLVELRVHGVTPEYAKVVKQQYPGVTLDQLVQLRIFNINDAFIAAAKRHGFTSLSIEKLVQLRISGIMDDESEAK